MMKKIPPYINDLLKVKDIEKIIIGDFNMEIDDKVALHLNIDYDLTNIFQPLINEGTMKGDTLEKKR